MYLVFRSLSPCTVDGTHDLIADTRTSTQMSPSYTLTDSDIARWSSFDDHLNAHLARCTHPLGSETPRGLDPSPPNTPPPITSPIPSTPASPNPSVLGSPMASSSYTPLDQQESAPQPNAFSRMTERPFVNSGRPPAWWSDVDGQRLRAGVWNSPGSRTFTCLSPSLALTTFTQVH